MQFVGYSLIDSNNNEIEHWGNILGQHTSVPDVITLPNGDILNAPFPNRQYQGYTLVERWIDANPPSQYHNKTGENTSFDGEKVVVTYTYSTKEEIVPVVVTALQLRLALNQSNTRTQFENYVKTLDQNQQDSWNYGTEFRRTDNLITNAVSGLNKTDTYMDNLFRLANTL